MITVATYAIGTKVLSTAIINWIFCCQFVLHMLHSFLIPHSSWGRCIFRLATHSTDSRRSVRFHTEIYQCVYLHHWCSWNGVKNMRTRKVPSIYLQLCIVRIPMCRKLFGHAISNLSARKWAHSSVNFVTPLTEAWHELHNRSIKRIWKFTYKQWERIPVHLLWRLIKILEITIFTCTCFALAFTPTDLIHLQTNQRRVVC